MKESEGPENGTVMPALTILQKTEILHREYRACMGQLPATPAFYPVWDVAYNTENM